VTHDEWQDYLLLARTAARLRTAQDAVLRAADEIHDIRLDYMAALKRAVDAAQAELDKHPPLPDTPHGTQ